MGPVSFANTEATRPRTIIVQSGIGGPGNYTSLSTNFPGPPRFRSKAAWDDWQVKEIELEMAMKIRSALVPAFALLYASTAFAQDDHKLEVTVDYSYVHANPQNNNVIPTFSLNGGGGGIAYYSTSNIGIQAEFQGYGSYTHHFTLPPPFCSGPCTVSAQGNLFTYNIGPIVKFRPKHFEPFVEALFGGAHSNFYANLNQACAGACTVGRSPSNNAFDFIIGGGVDLPLGGHFAIRPAQFDYLLTRFGSAFTAGNNNQSNFRYQAGAQLRF